MPFDGGLGMNAFTTLDDRNPSAAACCMGGVSPLPLSPEETAGARGRRAPHHGPMPTTVAASSSTIVAVFLIAVIVLGYVVIWAIWHFGFRGRDDDGRRVDRGERD